MQTKLTLALILAAASLTNLVAQVAQPPQISVTGSAIVKVAPDEIFLRCGVETRDEGLDTAKRQNDDRIAKALEFLKTSGIASKEIQTDYINVESNYDHNVSRTRPTTYTVRRSIEIRLTKVELFERILTGLLNMGVTTVHGIEFRTSQLRKHRDQARTLAIRAAREKADALAAELEVKRGKVYSINAQDWGGWSSPGGWGGGYGSAMAQNVVQSSGGGDDSTDGTLSLGQISISASVNVSFLIE
jgi:uncharacterized protein YggE